MAVTPEDFLLEDYKQKSVVSPTTSPGCERASIIL